MSVLPECPGREEYSRVIQSAADACQDAAFLRGASVLITGATGMLGGALARTLCLLNRERQLELKLILPVRDLERAKNALRGISKDAAAVLEMDLTKEIDLSGDVDYIVHAAAPTSSREFVEKPASTLEGMALAGLNLMRLARKKQVKRYVYLSSMEVYGVQQGVVSERELGFLDLEKPRSCYPAAKRFLEHACLCCAAEYGLEACSLRLAQTFGAGVRPGDGRAYMQFALSALRGEDIVLKTSGASLGNYLHLADAVSAILCLMQKGAAGASYNACGDDCTVTIKQLAQRISALLSGGQSQVVCQNLGADALPYAQDTSFAMDNGRLKSLGWKPRYGLKDMICSLGRDLKQMGIADK